MFFDISDQANIDYPCHWQLGDLWVSTDAGWQRTGDIIYKGYADGCCLTDAILQPDKTVTGSFCALELCGTDVVVKTDRWRSVGIWHDPGRRVSNLHRTGDAIWARESLTVHSDLTISRRQVTIHQVVPDEILPEHEVLDQVRTILLDKVRQWARHNTLPVKVFLSGGIDSMLVYALVKQFVPNMEMIWHDHLDYDEFWVKNHGTVQKNWSYRQINHWRDPCVLTSGTPGDEFMLRNPSTVATLLMARGVNLLDHLQVPSANQAYFNKPSNRVAFEETVARYNPQRPLPFYYQDVMNANLNDVQHHHIGNTLTYTPLRDAGVLSLMMRLPTDSMLAQVLNNRFSMRLLESLDDNLSQYVSPQKNVGNALATLWPLIKQG